MADTPDSSRRTLETVSRACDIIKALEQLNGAGVTELANHLDLSKSSTHSYLATLQEKQLVVKNGNTYSLSLEFLYLGKTVRYQHILFQHGKDQTEELAEETGEFAHLMCEQHGLERNIYKVMGPNAIGNEYHTSKEQNPDYLHFTSAGKAVLAHLPEERLHEIVNRQGLISKTPNTITDIDTLNAELATIREQGYAVNDEEEIRGIRAVGAPICSPEGMVLGAVSVSGPTSRLSGEFYAETVPEKVVESANIIEANINMSTKKSQF
ncbi:transcriptional regulator [Natronococcus pandeyae]|uniref:Transcriptional regulator n=1 Tax=Natronococcus pandeyae TaxID=2055836 RepID=A0A8J8PZV0_9EURY|nr:IclR family transcriptional regulator [Natronococcus pandeyae]TYL36199.1 transcriptional regulator [Natronococcus pandeyae]